MALLSLLAVAAAVAPKAAGMMRPNLQAHEPPKSLVAELVGESAGTAARKTCAPQFDYLQPASADPVSLLEAATKLGAKELGSESLEGREAADRNRSLVRPCLESRTRVSTLEALVLPEYKLAFCYIPKVACTEFKNLFNEINGFGESSFGFGHDYYNSQYQRMKVSMTSMTKENGWKFAVFTRDPALRYLSAFGDTCTVKNKTSRLDGHTWSCCGQLMPTSEPVEFQAENFKLRLRTDLQTGRPRGEQHWALQTEVLESCGWDLFRPESVDYWGVLSGDVNGQVTEMLRMVNYTNPSAVNHWFPQDSVAGHTSELTGEVSDYINDLETIEGIVRLYEDDYRSMPGIGCSFTEPLLAKLRAAGNGTPSP